MKPSGFLILALALTAGSSTAFSAPLERGKDAKKVVVVMETSQGTIELELYPDKAPITVKNFLQYVDDKFYDGTIFHRVIKDFMIQGGGFKPGLVRKETRKPIKNEAGNGLSNVRGTIAMARTNDPDSATAQFYISTKDNSRGLDKTDRNPGYCVFGKVLKGMNVADKISEMETQQDVPVKDVVIKSVRRKK